MHRFDTNPFCYPYHNAKTIELNRLVLKIIMGTIVFLLAGLMLLSLLAGFSALAGLVVWLIYAVLSFSMPRLEFNTFMPENQQRSVTRLCMQYPELQEFHAKVRQEGRRFTYGEERALQAWEARHIELAQARRADPLWYQTHKL